MAIDGHPKVLIVDDNDMMRTLLRGILRAEECDVIGEARNGIAAIEAIKTMKPDIVFLDVLMPEMNGLDALKAIRDTYPDITVIMITGSPSKENVEASIENGAAGFIIKPFNSAKVIATLNRACGIAKK